MLHFYIGFVICCPYGNKWHKMAVQPPPPPLMPLYPPQHTPDKFFHRTIFKPLNNFRYIDRVPYFSWLSKTIFLSPNANMAMMGLVVTIIQLFKHLWKRFTFFWIFECLFGETSFEWINYGRYCSTWEDINLSNLLNFFISLFKTK